MFNMTIYIVDADDDFVIGYVVLVGVICSVVLTGTCMYFLPSSNI